jgi:TonB family protein
MHTSSIYDCTPRFVHTSNHFTDEELDALLVFYRSPAGQSMVEKLPALTAQSFQLAQARVTAILPQIQQMAQDFAKSCTECIRPPVIGGVAGMGNPHPPVQNAQSGVAFSAQAQRIPAGVMSGNLLDRVNPVYPPIAKAAHVQGMVILHALISKDGHIENIAAISGPPMLISSAEDAVKRWVYKPYLLNGEPTEVETTINVNFTFGPPQPAASSVPAGSTPPPDDPQTTNDVAPH